MIGLQSSTSTWNGRVEATSKIASQRPCHSPSPGGEGRGEGELNCSSGREPALTDILASGFRLLNSASAGLSSLFKPIQALSRLFKAKNKNNFFLQAVLGSLPRKSLACATGQGSPRSTWLLKAFESIGNRREEFGEAEGRMATERAGASESTQAYSRLLKVKITIIFSFQATTRTLQRQNLTLRDWLGRVLDAVVSKLKLLQGYAR
jgi:hypothetical protein